MESALIFGLMLLVVTVFYSLWFVRWCASKADEAYRKAREIDKMRRDEIARLGDGQTLLFWVCTYCQARVSLTDEPVETCPICRMPRDQMSPIQQVFVFPSKSKV